MPLTVRRSGIDLRGVSADIGACHLTLAWRTGPQPAVSLASFIWAHCLVRSRALDLQLAHGADDAANPAVNSGTAQLSLCMIPLLDLANHCSGPNATCTVRLRVRAGGSRYGVATCGTASPVNRHPASAAKRLELPASVAIRRLAAGSHRCRACSTVELVAVRSVPRGGELSISYGDRPLRDFLRGYAFTPNDMSFEVGWLQWKVLLHASACPAICFENAAPKDSREYMV
jgi:hypothetical protein